MSGRIFLSPPDVTDLEEQAVVRAIRSGCVAPLGPEVDAFEGELATRCGRGHAVALSSGSAALHLALLTAGVRPGDAVITASMTFAATAFAIMQAGAHPVFVDADESGNLNPALLEEAFDKAETQGWPVTAIVSVDLIGKVVDHPAIAAVAAAHGVPVISDAAESLGAVRDGKPAAAYGDVAAVSFNGNKIMTTSGGGALLTDDGDLAARVRYLATQARQPEVHYEHVEQGYNYRMSNLLAALGRAQLSRLDAMVARRRAHRSRYAALVAGVPGVTVFGEPSGTLDDPTHDNWWLTSLLIDEGVAGFTREDLRLALAGDDIEARPLWKPMHLQPVFAGVPAVVDGTSERLFRTGLSLPSGSALGEAEWTRIEAAMSPLLDRARAAAS